MCEQRVNQRAQNQVIKVQAPQQIFQRFHRAHRYMGFWWTSCLTVLLTGILVAWIPHLLNPEPPKGNVEGFVDVKVSQGLKKVEDVFRIHLLSSEEKGAAFAAYYNGKLVVNLWGGYADIEAWQPWKESTLANTFSLYNMVVTLCLGLLAERGQLDYDLPIATYWPDFAQNGKSKLTVRELLTEQTDLKRLNESISLYDVENSPWLDNMLAAQTLTPTGRLRRESDQGIVELYVDQIVRRVDPQQRNLRTFFQQEFAKPFDLEYYVGLPDTEHHRAARMRGHDMALIFDILFAPMELVITLLSYLRTPVFKEFTAITRLNDPKVRSAPVGSISGFSNARSLAKLYNSAILSPNPRISSRTWCHMAHPFITGIEDSYLAKQVGIMGNYSFSAAGELRTSPEGTAFIGHSGFGGQYAFVDTQRNISVAYITNYNSIYKSALDPRFVSLIRALYDNV